MTTSISVSSIWESTWFILIFLTAADAEGDGIVGVAGVDGEAPSNPILRLEVLPTNNAEPDSAKVGGLSTGGVDASLIFQLLMVVVKSCAAITERDAIGVFSFAPMSPMKDPSTLVLSLASPGSPALLQASMMVLMFSNSVAVGSDMMYNNWKPWWKSDDLQFSRLLPTDNQPKDQPNCAHEWDDAPKKHYVNEPPLLVHHAKRAIPKIWKLGALCHLESKMATTNMRSSMLLKT